ncbi:MAG TPA: hypothetical protein VLS45_02735, partial [Methylomicrobium sp.]|nr:hypothetical protein [Methylomicrobium sp.]
TTRRRTSRHVQFSAEHPPIIIRTNNTDESAAAATPPPITAAPSQPPGNKQPRRPQQATKLAAQLPPQTVTRSGRVIKRPARLND